MQDVSQLKGIVPPVITPLTDSGKVDAQALAGLIEYLIDGGVDGLFVLGSASEFFVFTDEDRMVVIETAVKAAQGRVPVLAGIMDNSTDRCVQHGLAARNAGVDALVLTAPYYASNSQTEILDHFRTVRELVDMPIMAYDIPITVKVKLAVDIVIRLAQEGTIIGLKDSSGDCNSLRDLIVRVADKANLRVFTGSEVMIDAVLLMGGHGGVPALANVAPREFAQLYREAACGDWEKARRTQNNLVKLAGITSQGLNGTMSMQASVVGGYKTALMLRGVIPNNFVGHPLLRYSEAEVTRVKAILDEYDAMAAAYSR